MPAAAVGSPAATDRTAEPPSSIVGSSISVGERDRALLRRIFDSDDYTLAFFGNLRNNPLSSLDAEVDLATYFNLREEREERDRPRPEDEQEQERVICISDDDDAVTKSATEVRKKGGRKKGDLGIRKRLQQMKKRQAKIDVVMKPEWKSWEDVRRENVDLCEKLEKRQPHYFIIRSIMIRAAGLDEERIKSRCAELRNRPVPATGSAAGARRTASAASITGTPGGSVNTPPTPPASRSGSSSRREPDDATRTVLSLTSRLASIVQEGMRDGPSATASASAPPAQPREHSEVSTALTNLSFTASMSTTASSPDPTASASSALVHVPPTSSLATVSSSPDRSRGDGGPPTTYSSIASRPAAAHPTQNPLAPLHILGRAESARLPVALDRAARSAPAPALVTAVSLHDRAPVGPKAMLRGPLQAAMTPPDPRRSAAPGRSWSAAGAAATSATEPPASSRPPLSGRDCPEHRSADRSPAVHRAGRGGLLDGSAEPMRDGGERVTENDDAVVTGESLSAFPVTETLASVKCSSETRGPSARPSSSHVQAVTPAICNPVPSSAPLPAISPAIGAHTNLIPSEVRSISGSPTWRETQNSVACLPTRKRKASAPTLRIDTATPAGPKRQSLGTPPSIASLPAADASMSIRRTPAGHSMTPMDAPSIVPFVPAPVPTPASTRPGVIHRHHSIDASIFSASYTPRNAVTSAVATPNWGFATPFTSYGGSTPMIPPSTPVSAFRVLSDSRRHTEHPLIQSSIPTAVDRTSGSRTALRGASMTSVWLTPIDWSDLVYDMQLFKALSSSKHDVAAIRAEFVATDDCPSQVPGGVSVRPRWKVERDLYVRVQEADPDQNWIRMAEKEKWIRKDSRGTRWQCCVMWGESLANPIRARLEHWQEKRRIHVDRGTIDDFAAACPFAGILEQLFGNLSSTATQGTPSVSTQNLASVPTSKSVRLGVDHAVTRPLPQYSGTSVADTTAGEDGSLERGTTSPSALGDPFKLIAGPTALSVPNDTKLGGGIEDSERTETPSRPETPPVPEDAVGPELNGEKSGGIPSILSPSVRRLKENGHSDVIPPLTAKHEAPSTVPGIDQGAFTANDTRCCAVTTANDDAASSHQTVPAGDVQELLDRWSSGFRANSVPSTTIATVAEQEQVKIEGFPTRTADGDCLDGESIRRRSPKGQKDQGQRYGHTVSIYPPVDDRGRDPRTQEQFRDNRTPSRPSVAREDPMSPEEWLEYSYADRLPRRLMPTDLALAYERSRDLRRLRDIVYAAKTIVLLRGIWELYDHRCGTDNRSTSTNHLVLFSKETLNGYSEIQDGLMRLVRISGGVNPVDAKDPRLFRREDRRYFEIFYDDTTGLRTQTVHGKRLERIALLPYLRLLLKTLIKDDAPPNGPPNSPRSAKKAGGI